MVMIYDRAWRGRVWYALSCRFKVRGKTESDSLESLLCYIIGCGVVDLVL